MFVVFVLGMNSSFFCTRFGDDIFVGVLRINGIERLSVERKDGFRSTEMRGQHEQDY